MSIFNEHYFELKNGFLFAEVTRRVEEYKKQHPDRKVISLGVGDVTKPLPDVCIQAMHKAVDELSRSETFRGYGPEQGYAFLRQAIVDYEFAPLGVNIGIDEVFISEGAISDCGNIVDLFDQDCAIGIPDPAYPVYMDSNVMNGRAKNITILPINQDNGFVPQIPEKHLDVVYLCYPNNPTGLTMNREQLTRWVEYALREKCVILYDSAYVSYIRHEGIPHSIFEIEGAEKCAIEFRSFSKTAGFTGVRCGYTVVPKALTFSAEDGRTISLNYNWNRRQCTKFNGTSYISQRAAAAIYSEEGQRQVRENVDGYMKNADLIRETLKKYGYDVLGGEDAPYIWLRTPDGMGSWEFFDKLLNELSIVTTPGSGFGQSGEGFVRLSSFGRPEDCVEAMKRIEQWKY